MIEPGKLREDLTFLLQTIQDVHPNPHMYITPKEFRARSENVFSQLDHTMSQSEFYQHVAPLVASLRNGHTYVERPTEFEEHIARGGRLFPFSLYWTGQEAILSESCGFADLPAGAALLGINEEEAARVVAGFGRYLAPDGKESNPWMIARDEWLWFWLWVRYGTGQLRLRVRTVDGQVLEPPVETLPLEAMRSRTPYPRPDYGYRPILGHNAALLEFNHFRNDGRFERFLAGAFADIRERKLSTLIIDLRKSRGGNNVPAEAAIGYLTDKPFKLLEEIATKVSPQLRAAGRWFPPDLNQGDFDLTRPPFVKPGDNPLRFTGKVLVLIGPLTYSMGLAFAAAVRHYGLGTLIGQETGDRKASFGGPFACLLPNSELRVHVASCRVVNVGGDQDEGPLRPHFDIRQKPTDTAKHMDTALGFALELAGRRGSWAGPKSNL